MNKETSARVSSLAGKIMSLQPRTIDHGFSPADHGFNDLLHDAKILAGSCMSQDETPGQEPLGWQARLQTEYRELKSRLNKLEAFLLHDAPGVTDDVQKGLLECQASAMRVYAGILNMRLRGLPAELPHRSRPRVASEGEPVETGGHDIDRDGPVPFGD